MTAIKFTGEYNYKQRVYRDKVYRYLETDTMDKRIYLKDDCIIVGGEFKDDEVYGVKAMCEASISQNGNLSFTAYCVEIIA